MEVFIFKWRTVLYLVQSNTVNRDFKQIATATSTTAAVSKKAPK